MTDFLDRLAVLPSVPEIDAPDDWRGEHKIRSARLGGVNVQRGNEHRRKVGTCAEPGCEKKIEARNVTGYCQKHWKARAGQRICSAEGCDRQLDRRNEIGFCRDHRHLSGYLDRRDNAYLRRRRPGSKHGW